MLSICLGPVSFDDAFYSRIHLTLRFPELDISSRKAIWRNFVEPTGSVFSDSEFENLAQTPLNGRQIKNVIKISRLLAKNEASMLMADHVKDVMAVMEDDVGLMKAIEA